MVSGSVRYSRMICSMSAGTVAEKSSCWQSSGRWSRIRVTSSKNPMLSISSASSRQRHHALVEQVEGLAADVVVDPARRADHDLGAGLELVELVAHRGAAVDGHHREVAVLGRAPANSSATWMASSRVGHMTSAEGLRAAVRDALEDGDGEGGGLAGAGLGADDDVLAGADGAEGARLHRGGAWCSPARRWRGGRARRAPSRRRMRPRRNPTDLGRSSGRSRVAQVAALSVKGAWRLARLRGPRSVGAGAAPSREPAMRRTCLACKADFSYHNPGARKFPSLSPTEPRADRQEAAPPGARGRRARGRRARRRRGRRRRARATARAGPRSPAVEVAPEPSGTGLARSDPLRAYMAEVSRHPLLTREEEHELAVRYARDRRPRRPPTSWSPPTCDWW